MLGISSVQALSMHSLPQLSLQGSHIISPMHRGGLRLRKEMELAQGQVSSWHSLGRLPLCTAIALVQSSGLAGWGQVPGRAVGHCWPPGGER